MKPGRVKPVRVYAVLLCGTATVVTVALAVAGAARPSAGVLLLLAVVAAVCVNRYALFPSEHAATAEAALLLATVVGCRDGAVLLGPLMVALLVGPLDALHWEQRSFVRMAYNAGNRGLAVLAASVTLVAARDVLDGSVVSWCVVLVGAATAFVVVDLLLSNVLLQLLGTRSVAALRHLLEVDALTLPIALSGAAVGLLLRDVGWWAIALALVPVAFVPELVVTRARRCAHVARDLALVVGVAALLVLVAAATSLPVDAALATLLVLALLAGAEVVAARSVPVALPAVLVVVAAVVVVDRAHTLVVVVIVAAVAVCVSWCSASGPRSRAGLLVALSTALVAASAAAVLSTALSPALVGVAFGALVAGIGCEGCCLLGGTGRRRRAVAATWCLPLLAATVAWSLASRAVGPTGGVVLVLGVVATGAIASVWAALPWRSRLLTSVVAGARGALVPPALVPRALVVAATVSLACALVGVLQSSPEPASAWSWVATAVAESVTAVVALGVHQWRFVPRARAVALAVLVVASVGLLLVPEVATAAGAGWSVALLVAFLAVVLDRARPVTRAVRRDSEAGDVATSADDPDPQVPVP